MCYHDAMNVLGHSLVEVTICARFFAAMTFILIAQRCAETRLKLINQSALPVFPAMSTCFEIILLAGAASPQSNQM